MNKTKIIVGAAGRSGTLYLSKVFSILGLDVAHERAGEDGIVSWFHSFGNRQKRLLHNDYKDCDWMGIHLVRNPIEAIQSMAIVSHVKKRRGLSYFVDLCPDIALQYKRYELAMVYWVHWNFMIEHRSIKIKHRLKIEDLYYAKGVRELCEAINIKYKPIFTTKIKRLSKTEHAIKAKLKKSIIAENDYLQDPLTSEHLKKVNHKLFSQVVKLAKRYGYQEII